MVTDKIVVRSGASELARHVGPTALTVLIALAFDSEPSGGQMLARASVRSLAYELGMNKDTVARAINRLRHAGLLRPEAGRFERAIYRLTISTDVISILIDGPTDAIRPHRRVAREPATQLTLLEGTESSCDS
jgi:DNA-binding transcriptional MocR family regulator